MPTVSAAFGCSPTARVRRPQRERNSRTWRTIDEDDDRHRDRALVRNIVEDPADDRQVDQLVGRRRTAVKLPAPSATLVEMSSCSGSRSRRRRAMLMIVPLMIWSARTRDRQPGVERPRRRTAGGDRRDQTDEERRRRPRRSARVARAEDRRDQDAGHDQPTNAARQHHALDADVHDAGPLAHDAAQGAERDRRRRPEG